MWIDDALTPHPVRRVELPPSRTGENGDLVFTWDYAEPPLFSRISVEWERPPRDRVSWSVHPLNPLPPHKPPRHQETQFRRAFGFDDDAVVVGDLRFPERLAPGEPLVIAPRIQTTARVAEELGELVFFVHLLDQRGNQVFARDVPLVQMTFHPEPALPHDLGIPPLPPGEYQIRVGLYRPRPEIRLKPDLPRNQTDRHRRVMAGTLEIGGP